MILPPCLIHILNRLGNILWENHFEYPVSCAFRVVKHPDLKTRFSLLKVYPLKKPRRSSPYINSNPGPGSGTLHSPPSQQQQSYMGLMDGSLFTLPTRYFEIDYNTPLISAGSSSSVEIIENGKAVLVSVDDGGAGYGGEEGEVVNNDREIIHGVTACAVGTPGYPNCLPFTIDPPPSPLPPSYSSTSLIDIIFDASSWNGQTMASAILTLCTIIITFILLSRKLFSKGLKARNSNTAPILDEKEQAATTTTTTATQMVSENKQGLPVEDEKGLESITAPLLVTTTSQTTSTLVFSSSLSPSSSSNESSSNPTAGSTSTPSSSRGGSGGKEVAIDEKNNMASSQVESLKSLEVSDIVLGYGSHGTVVYKGKFSNRPVAIKRLLLDFYSVAENEVKLLQDSDHHPNIVRYYFQETTTRFMYIALELSPASIHDVIEKRSLPKYMQIATRLKWKVVMNMILRGLRHLHHLNIVHR